MYITPRSRLSGKTAECATVCLTRRYDAASFFNSGPLAEAAEAEAEASWLAYIDCVATS